MDKRFVADYFRQKRAEAELRHQAYMQALWKQHPSLQDLQTRLTELGREELKAAVAQNMVELNQIRKSRANLQAEERQYLTKHNLPVAYREVHYSCPLCKDTGMADFKPCTCYQNYLVSQAVFPEEEQAIKHASFANFNLQLFSEEDEGQLYHQRGDMAALLKYAQNYVDHFEDFAWKDLFLAGFPGTGKTYLVACILHALRERGILSVFITAQSLFGLLEEEELLKRSFNPDPVRLDFVKSRLELIFAARLLVVDDLGAETMPKDLRVGYLLRVLNHHTCPESRLLLTTNLDKDHLLEYYDERILSRLTEHFYYIYLAGKDIRKLI